MFSDISSEMVTSILPLYLTFQLRFSALQYGLIDGAALGTTAVVRLLGGALADRRQRHKDVAFVGYATSAACRLGLVAAGSSWGAVTGVQLADRVGKGIRTPPRDALISFSSDEASLGRSFGIHRAFDTAGALLGPLVAFLVLQVAPRDFKAVLVISFCFAVVGLGVLGLLVQAPARSSAVAPPDRTLRRSLLLLRVPAFRRLVCTGGVLGLVTISDAFIYLLIQRDTGMAIGFFPLLFVGTATTYLLLAVPLGRFSDRHGRRTTFLGGYVALLSVYALLFGQSGSTTATLAALLLLGVHYAATDGILMAMASPLVPPDLRTSGLALVTTVTSLGRFGAAITFGLLWDELGTTTAIGCFAVALVCLLPVAARLLAEHDRAAVVR